MCIMEVIHLSGMWLGMAPRMNIRRHMFKRDWTMSLKIRYSFKVQYSWRDFRYDHFMSMRMFVLLLVKIFI
jgi:hypothetical protein